MAVLQYKCPNCTGGIEFDQSLQKMLCPFCQTEFEATALEEFNAVEEAPQHTEWLQSGGEEWNDSDLQGFTCPSCAGELLGDAKTASTRCPYCGNPTVLPARLSGVFKPDCIIPFKLDNAAAKTAFAEKLKGKKLLPKQFADQSVLEEIVGSYVPFWLFDCQAKANGTWRATRVKTWSDRRFHYTKTDHFQLRRAGDAAFTQIPVDACSKMDSNYMDAIEPFDHSGIQPFQMTFLSGYLADMYDVTAEQCRPRIESRCGESMEQALTGAQGGRGGYNSVRKESSQAWLTQAKASYALMPVWNLNAKFEGQNYRFAMNGQTGKFVGQLPVCKKRSAAWWFGLFGGISVAMILIFALLFGGLNIFWSLVGLGIGVFTASAVVSAFKKQMNTALPQKAACNYMGNFRITKNQDTFLFSNTQRVRVNQGATVVAAGAAGGAMARGMSRPSSGSFKGGGSSFKGGGGGRRR
ncbi:MAG: hypothetical protein FWB76_03975 [Oscillospiraceae bacterium]|nr:hypothetical protein [Oscillospiraceae bacterium]